jgi:hypothetical protein
VISSLLKLWASFFLYIIIRGLKNMPFKAGQRVRVTGVVSGHNMPVGSNCTVTGYAGQFVRVRESASNFYEVDLQLLSMTKDEITDELQKRKAEASLLEDKLEFLEENFSEELDEEQFKSYLLRKLLQDEETPVVERAEKIKNLLKG